MLEKTKAWYESVPVLAKHLFALGLTVGMWWTGYYVGDRGCAARAADTLDALRSKLEDSERRLRQHEQENFYNDWDWNKGKQDG